MAKFEAVIDLTVEIDAENSDQADLVFFGEFTNELLALAKDRYKIWIDIRQIEETK